MPDKVKALEIYSRECKRDLKPKLTRYATLFQEASRAKSRAALYKALRDKVLPALNTYVTALQQIRPKPQKLKQIHHGLTHAYTHWYEAVRRFSKGLGSDAAWVQVAAGLQHGAAQVAKAEQQHHKQLKEYARPPKRRRPS